MKILCFILSVWIVALSAMPCCSDDSCDDEAVAVEQTSHGEESCANCPPLLACGTCVGFVFDTVSFSFQIMPSENKKNITPWSESAVMNWPVKIWQPPKLA